MVEDLFDLNDSENIEGGGGSKYKYWFKRGRGLGGVFACYYEDEIKN